ncbi:MAG: hypothetical protein ACR2NR_04515 [Solirubrobacteraceae bacterium]
MRVELCADAIMAVAILRVEISATVICPGGPTPGPRLTPSCASDGAIALAPDAVAYALAQPPDVNVGGSLRAPPLSRRPPW